MNEARREKLSALMDGELDKNTSARVLDDLRDDSELMAVWERYHMASSALRHELGLGNKSVSGEIFRRLQDEPAILAPQPWRRIAMNPVTRAVGSVAIAASVAMVAIFGLDVGKDDPVQPQLAVGQPQVAVKPVSDADFIRAGETRWKKRTPEMERTLNMYLVEHNEFNPASSFKGMMGYGRVVGYDNEK